MYAKIQNPGVCPTDRFTILGLTTSRSSQEKIGQFGSGAKHAILTLLRAGVSFVIYSGCTEIKFFTKTKISGGHEYEQVYVSIDGEETALNIALDYGELDWKESMEMAMRELIANAIDASSDINDVMVSITNQEPCGYDNKTTIYIDANLDVQNYVKDLEHRFLHFNNDVKSLPKIIDKEACDKVRFYHKGVFVKFGYHNSLFDYNFGDEIKIDESRNLDHYNCGTIVSQYLSSDKIRLRKVFRELKNNKSLFETSIYEYTLERVARENQQSWRDAWVEEFGKNALVCSISDGLLVEKALEEGYTLVLITNNSWVSALIHAGIKTPISVLGNVNEEGHELFPPSKTLKDNIDMVWDWFEKANLIGDKVKPKAFLFRDCKVGKVLKCGYYKDDTIYVNKEMESSVQTVFEELAHHITDYMDCTREFQNFIIEYAVRMST